MRRRGEVGHRRWASLAAVVAWAVVGAPVAGAHVTVTPPSVEIGVPSELRLDVPNERDGYATVSLVIEVPRGLEVVSVTSPDGWDVRTSERRATWTGGRIEARASVPFALTVEACPPARRVELLARQRYDDGGTVTWRPSLLVLPAPAAASPEQHLGRAVVAGIVGLVVVGGTVVALGLLRRRARRDG